VENAGFVAIRSSPDIMTMRRDGMRSGLSWLADHLVKHVLQMYVSAPPEQLQLAVRVKAGVVHEVSDS
jgi:hypothetical protein